MSMEGPALAVAGSTARKGRRGATVNRKEIETNLKLRVIPRYASIAVLCQSISTPACSRMPRSQNLPEHCENQVTAERG